MTNTEANSPQTLEGDTIVAIATAPGRGGIGIIRISGERALSIASKITSSTLQPRFAHFCQFQSSLGDVLDTGIALSFPAPNSFTGEDVVELQAHGGPVLLDLLLEECCLLGARLARAGEFSERAFLNDKIDLAQAEAIADLINSTTAQGARNASASLQGAFSDHLDALQDSVMQLRVYIEAAIDFPEEEIDFISEGRVAERLDGLLVQLGTVQQQATQGALIQEGMKLVIAGKPNAGKSSLLNALSGRDTAIVTSVEGTTRDVLRQHIQLDGMPLHIVDTAGLRDSGDEVEQEGIRRAWLEIESADRILLVVDSTEHENWDGAVEEILKPGEQAAHRDIPVTIIQNKADLAKQVSLIEETVDEVTTGRPLIHLSAKTGEGMDLLRTHLKESMGYREDTPGQFSARRRHLQSLEEAANYLETGQRQLREAGAGELLAEDLRECQNCLGQITGAISNDELLGEIFSSFCIGK